MLLWQHLSYSCLVCQDHGAEPGDFCLQAQGLEQSGDTDYVLLHLYTALF